MLVFVKVGAYMVTQSDKLACDSVHLLAFYRLGLSQCFGHRGDIAAAPGDIGNDTVRLTTFASMPHVLPLPCPIAQHHYPDVKRPSIYLGQRNPLLNNVLSIAHALIDDWFQFPQCRGGDGLSALLDPCISAVGFPYLHNAFSHMC